jgi:hypothetical protein
MISVLRILFEGTSGFLILNFCILCLFEPGTSRIESSCAVHSAATF